jgi:hypothetical protein
MMEPTKWAGIPRKQQEYDEAHDTLIRQSTLNQMDFCGYRTMLSTNPGYLAPVSEAMVFGTCVHYMIAQDIAGYPNIASTLELLSNMYEWVEPILVEEYDWSLDKVTTNIRDFFSELTSAFTMWKSVVQPSLPEMEVVIEQEMFLPLGEGERGTIILKGTPDAIYEDHIIDWKTSGRAWKESKAHHSIQVDAYMALAKQNLNVSIRDFVFWVYNRQKREWACIPTSRRVVDINASLSRLLDYGKVLESGRFHATPTTETFGEVRRGWYCTPKYCGAWNVCPAKYLNDDTNEKEKAIRSW